MNISKKFPWTLLIVMIVLFAVYLIISLNQAPTASGEKLGLGQGQEIKRMMISLTFALPLFISYFFGLWGSSLLRRAKLAGWESSRFKSLALGIKTLTLTLLIGTILGQARLLFLSAGNDEAHRIFTIIINYLYSFGFFSGFYLFWHGSTNPLANVSKGWNILASALVVILIGTLYNVAIFTNPNRSIWLDGVPPSHYLNDWLIGLTVVAPSMLAWFWGILSAFNIADLYSVPAVETRQRGVRNIFYGIIFIIFNAILLQAILSVGTARFILIGLPLTLGLLYIFSIALALGNFFVVRGAKKLAADL
ncbi:MAG: hypothetical protein Q8O59_03190 [bacterium]|nr:hypothetical protein [bacterium]